MTDSLVEYALRLAEHGFAVFPLTPQGKPYGNCAQCKNTCEVAEDYEKCEHLFCHACYSGTKETGKVAEMWKHLPKSLIGIRTGAASGIFVLDFDMHEGGKNGHATYAQLVRERKLPPTVTARTGGGGLHLFYQHPGKPVPNDNRGKLGDGVDVKGDGGFVIAAPSAKRGKPAYAWLRSPFDRDLAALDNWVLDPLWKQDEIDETQPQRRQLVPPAEGFALALKQLAEATAGNRNDALHRAACRAGEAIANGDTDLGTATSFLHEAAATCGGLSSQELRNTIRSGIARGRRDHKGTK